MILGVVSNCWREQLRAGHALESLIADAVERGFEAIELRQTCLGNFESGPRHLPNSEDLRQLPEQFDALQINLAMALPYLSPLNDADASMFRSGLAAAVAVGGRFTPHLRLVDLATQIAPSEIDGAADALSRLVDEAADAGVWLSVENSVQPWSLFREVFDRVSLSRTDGHHLRLCYDAANLLLQPDPVQPGDVTQSLRADRVAMVHFKQREHGNFLDSVCDGEIDWRRQFEALAQIGYRGPGLFEIESTPDVWTSLDESRRYLETMTGVCS